MKSKLSQRLGSLVIFFIFFIILAIIIYIGYEYYIEKYYIKLYDNDMIKYLDIPPYSKRITPSYYELLGECKVKTFLTLDEIKYFYSSTLVKKGYSIKHSEQDYAFEIVVGKDYTVKCKYNGKDDLTFLWTPRLNSNLSKQLYKYFPDKKNKIQNK